MAERYESRVEVLDHNGVCDLVELPKGCKKLAVNLYSRPDVAQMAI